jgi:hypothetical protein
MSPEGFYWFSSLDFFFPPRKNIQNNVSNDGTVKAKTDLNLNIYASSLLFVDVIAYGAPFPRKVICRLINQTFACDRVKN